jgi:hypothetical protein
VAETRSPTEAQIAAEARCCSCWKCHHFSRDPAGRAPDLLLEVDATDPASSGYAVSAFRDCVHALRDDLKGR